MGSYMSQEDIEDIESSLCKRENIETYENCSRNCINICLIVTSYITYPIKKCIRRFYNDMKFDLGHEE